MLRFITSRNLCAICKRSPSKGQANRSPFLQSGLSVQKVNFFTKSPNRKDAPFPNPRVSDAPLPNPRVSDAPDTLDLDKWKAVMRQKAAPQENIQVGDEGENDEDIEDNMTLEANRELVTMWRHAGKLVPQEINDEELQTLAAFTTKSAKISYLKYLGLKEGFKKSKKMKQEKKKAEKEAWLEQKAKMEGDESDTLKNSLILQFWNRSLDKLLAWRVAQAMVFGQPLVFDLSYEGNMSKREIENTVSQLMEAEGWNRRATDPYHLHFCNLQPDSYHTQQLIKRYGAEAWDRLLITSTDKQHFELFPREQLVYLTADSPNVLRTYDHNKVYIIGGMVDRTVRSGLSLANAKRLQLATARLPLDEFLHWETGAKNLTLDQMIRIMLTLKQTGKWEEALQFVPTRKHDGFHPHQQKETKTVMNKREYMPKSGGISLKNRNLNNTNIMPTPNRPKIAKTNIENTKRATKSRNWLKEE
uniref:tRNA methyltransferase 10 homolog C n=1 Tax=Neogobius melanostomus TaxID=47308 RepID=A0A8C6TT85_9GOBI